MPSRSIVARGLAAGDLAGGRFGNNSVTALPTTSSAPLLHIAAGSSAASDCQPLIRAPSAKDADPAARSQP